MKIQVICSGILWFIMMVWPALRYYDNPRYPNLSYTSRAKHIYQRYTWPENTMGKHRKPIWYQFPDVTAHCPACTTTWVAGLAATACVSVIAANLRSSYPSQWGPGWIKTEWRLSSFQVGKILVVLWAAKVSQFFAASESWLLGKYIISSTTLALQTPSQSNHLRWSHNPADSDTLWPPGSSIKLGNID